MLAARAARVSWRGWSQLMSRGADGGGLDPKVLLAALVLKLNLLEPQDLAGALTAEQKAVVARQLAELAELPELSPEEAHRRRS